MPKIQGILKVKSTDDKETIKLTGIKRDNVWTMQDSQAVKYRFEYQNEMLKYDKQSEEKLNFLFDVYRETEAWYEVHQRKINFRVKTEKLLVDNHDLQVSYQLYQGDMLLNTVIFSLQCELLEEDQDDRL